MTDEIDFFVDGKKVEPIEESEVFGVGVCPAGGKHTPAGMTYSFLRGEERHEFAVCSKCASAVLVYLSLEARK